MAPLIIRTPPSRSAERAHALEVIVGQWLGLEYEVVHEPRLDTSIRLGGASATDAASVRLPDTFFGGADEHWLEPESLPSGALEVYDAGVLRAPARLVDTRIPVLFGDAALPAPESGDLALPIDIVGSAFFMLSRYEEAVVPVRDPHGRFPAGASVAYQHGFLERPLVDEYVELLWAALHALWPGLERTEPAPRTLVSCDLDLPFVTYEGPGPVLRRAAGDALKRGAPVRGLRSVTAWAASACGLLALDPYRRAIDWMMDVNEARGNRVAFNVLPERTHPTFDLAPSLEAPRMRALLRTIHERGHEIGLHPGYSTYRDAASFERSADTLRRVFQEEGIDQPALGGRQHYLRWETPTTARLWSANGLEYDSTLGFADRAGFRCGTCREYPLFDVRAGEGLRVRERPLVVMEASVMSDEYMGLGHGDEALRAMTRLKEACQRVRGDFSLLWHNSSFEAPGDRRVYEAIV